MNYLAHALPHLDRPYVVAGTSVPDWLSVVDRRVRARSAAAERLLNEGDARVADLATGIVHHHADDRWFHGTRAFAELNLAFAVELRRLLPGDDGFRPTFLGHILVEILVDADLIGEDPGRAHRYYDSLGQISGPMLQQTVDRITPRPAEGLRLLLPRFIAERFLYDYLENDTLLVRLNQVMHRARLPALPEQLVGWLDSARLRVAQRREELLARPSSAD